MFPKKSVSSRSLGSNQRYYYRINNKLVNRRASRYDQAPINGDAWLDNDDNNARVMRGGSWRNEPFLCRSSSRQFNYANEMLNNIGFRVIRSL
ncbi:MAG: SUMF1/EgtB/PvdO family nonheme iron enzyme [Scytonema sp. RU_4_4]|nr:SUMF1/EgtB/PvdO family nonheme iron enzyme [Scytonema sp. RU_4_4]NJR76802.1 SUMF1/EgtB/PvdO family nonheme iron enzyme [Scytonema sp. CRU_2_7]